MKSELEEKIKTYIAEREKKSLSEFASRSNEGIRRKTESHNDIRAIYSRDCDRIMHTRAYSRYIDKTQVFYLVENDHITHRVLHVQFVSKIARTIGRALQLNEDLIEAMALGHDIGHVPFGHKGEGFLSSLCIKHGIGGFAHNAQSVQFLDVIENCNLTIQVLDGILCHNGEVLNRKLSPNRYKDWDDFETEIQKIKDDINCAPEPMTLEGCVVRFSDRIAYLGRDIQDSLESGLIENVSQVPDNCKEVIGISNREIINTLIVDLIENSYGEDFITYSKDISDSMVEYREFFVDIIYENPILKAEIEKIELMFKILYEKFLGDLDNKSLESKIYKDFINPEWVNHRNLNNAEKVRDYIAGMTDRYFERVFKDSVLPSRVETYKKPPSAKTTF